MTPREWIDEATTDRERSLRKALTFGIELGLSAEALVQYANVPQGLFLHMEAKDAGGHVYSPVLSTHPTDRSASFWLAWAPIREGAPVYARLRHRGPAQRLDTWADAVAFVAHNSPYCTQADADAPRVLNQWDLD